MNKDEILAKSRADHKNADTYEREVLRQARNWAMGPLLALATLFFFLQILAGKGINWGIYAMVFSGNAAMAWVNYVKLGRRRELFHALALTLFVLALSGCHIYDLFAG